MGCIMDERLSTLGFGQFPFLLKRTVFLSLEYAKLQSKAFRTIYVDAFTKDTCNAYGRIGKKSSIENMSCAQGVLERIFLSLLPARLTALDEIRTQTNAKNPGLQESDLKKRWIKTRKFWSLNG